MKVLYIDMDNVLVDFRSAFDRLDPSLLNEYKTRLDEVPGIFGLMDPMPGAIDAFVELCGRYDTYVLSTSPLENPTAWSDKLLWVKKHLGKYAYKRLILSHHKNLNTGDFLVDDRTERGADKFAGELVLFGSDRFPNWRVVTEYLLVKAT